MPGETGSFLLAAKFLALELFVVKGIIGQSECVGMSGFRPSGFGTGAAFGACFGLLWHFSSALGAEFRLHKLGDSVRRRGGSSKRTRLGNWRAGVEHRRTGQMI